MVYLILGDWHRAASLLEEAMQFYTKAGDLLHLAEAPAYLRDGFKIFEEISAVEQQANAFAAMARIAMAAGREDEGLGHMQRALRMAETTNNRLAAAVVNRLEAELLASDGFKGGAGGPRRLQVLRRDLALR